MKQYKVGDEVLVKGKVYGIDDDSGSYSYLVDFDKPFGTSPSHYWVRNNYIADEEPVKPVLPKDVADEIEGAKKTGYHFVGYMNKAIDNDYDETNGFVYLADLNTDEMIKILSDAWYNGYTVEPEKKFLVKIPHVIGGIYRKTTTGSPVTASHRNEWLNISKEFKSRYEFTDEEITKFNLQDCEKELVTDD